MGCDILKKSNSVEIPVSNYIKLFLLMAATIVLSLILSKAYIDSVEYESKIPVIRQSLTLEIKPDELYSYVRENQDSIIYMCASDDSECRRFEEEFNKYIEKNKLKDIITYLNLTDCKKKDFINEFNKFYGTKLLGYPSLVIFKDGEVSDIITTSNKIEIDDVVRFLERSNITDYYD